MEKVDAVFYSAPLPSLDLPEAFQEPTKPVGIGLQAAVLVGYVAYSLCFISITVFLLPLQLSQIDPANKVGDLAFISMLGGILAVLTTPVVGALSDRTTSRFGRRRPWLFVGAIFMVMSLVILMNARAVVSLLAGWCAFQLFSSLVFASLITFIPDLVPEKQRGTISGIFGLGLPLGIIIGSILVGQVIKTTSTSYVVLIAVALISCAIVLLSWPDKVLPRNYVTAFNLRNFLANFWVSPRKYPDFAWAWLTRLLPYLGYFMGFNYLLYYLQDAVKYEKVFPGQTAAQGAATVNIISTLVLIVATIVGGIVSDKLQRRKIPVIVSMVCLAIAQFLFAFFPVWSVVLIAAAIMGFGFGAYLAVDMALVTFVLPSAESRAKDMGVINMAQALPQVLAPIAAGIIVTQTGSYMLLFVIAAVVTLSGIFAVTSIKSVR